MWHPRPPFDAVVLLFSLALAGAVALAFGVPADNGVRAGQEQRVLSGRG